MCQARGTTYTDGRSGHTRSYAARGRSYMCTVQMFVVRRPPERSEAPRRRTKRSQEPTWGDRIGAGELVGLVRGAAAVLVHVACVCGRPARARNVEQLQGRAREQQQQQDASVCRAKICVQMCVQSRCCACMCASGRQMRARMPIAGAARQAARCCQARAGGSGPGVRDERDVGIVAGKKRSFFPL